MITTALFLLLTGAVWVQIVPSFELPWLDEKGNLRLVLRGGAGVSYTIEGSTNLVDWAALYTDPAADGHLELSATIPDGQGFFRGLAWTNFYPNPTNPPPPSGMVLIPDGGFQKDNSKHPSEGVQEELSLRTVSVRRFPVKKSPPPPFRAGTACFK